MRKYEIYETAQGYFSLIAETNSKAESIKIMRKKARINKARRIRSIIEVFADGKRIDYRRTNGSFNGTI